MEKISEKDRKVDPTEIIQISDIDSVEQELREMSKEELLHRLNFEEKDPEVCALIKKILKTKA